MPFGKTREYEVEPRLTDDVCSEVLLSLDRGEQEEVQSDTTKSRRPSGGEPHIYPQGMEASSWQWPKGVVSGAIPTSYFPMPAIEDEVEDFFGDKDLQTKVNIVVMERYNRVFSSHVQENAGGFKEAIVGVDDLKRFNGKLVVRGGSSAGGDGGEEAGRGGIRNKKAIRVSVRLCNSSSRTNVINHDQIDSSVKQLMIPTTNVANFLQKEPAYVTRATFPKYLRNPSKPDPCNIANRPDGNNFQLESFPRYNNNTMKNEDDVFGNSIVWCEHKNSKKSRKHSSSLANPSLGPMQVVSDCVNGTVLKGTEHRKPSEVKVVVSVGGKLMLGHAENEEAELDSPLNGAHNAMAMVDVPKCMKGVANSVKEWYRGAGIETTDGEFSFLSPRASLPESTPESTAADDETSNRKNPRPTRKRVKLHLASPPTPTCPPPTVKKYTDGFVEPLICHVPLEDGPLRAVCLKPGNLSAKPINFNLDLVPPSSHEDPDDPAIQATYICAVCKTSDSSEAKMYKVSEKSEKGRQNWLHASILANPCACHSASSVVS
jgi:hypothetical protein